MTVLGTLLARALQILPPEQAEALAELRELARNGKVVAVGPGARGGLVVPGESIICPWTTPLAFATDALARPITDRLSALWKVPVVIENKPGANTAIGTDTVAKSSPDGHVLGMVTLSHIMNPLLGASLPDPFPVMPYDVAMRDYGVDLYGNVIVADPDFMRFSPKAVRPNSEPQMTRVSSSSPRRRRSRSNPATGRSVRRQRSP